MPSFTQRREAPPRDCELFAGLSSVDLTTDVPGPEVPRQPGRDEQVYGNLGRETAGWQSWHCAAEWGLHRHDVEVALGRISLDGTSRQTSASLKPSAVPVMFSLC
jgi:hypothetical protein